MRMQRRWRVVALLAAGIAVGVVISATPATGHVAGWAHNWKTHIRPKADKRYLPSNQNTLLPGKTVRGTWAIQGKSLATGEFATADISFGWAFPASPTPHVIRSGDPAPADCPGTLQDPRAKAGHLCIWESSVRANAGVLEVYDWTVASYDSASRVGTTILGRPSSNDARFYMAGTWAATAGPKPSAAATSARVSGCPADLEPAC